MDVAEFKQAIQNERSIGGQVFHAIGGMGLWLFVMVMPVISLVPMLMLACCASCACGMGMAVLTDGEFGMFPLMGMFVAVVIWSIWLGGFIVKQAAYSLGYGT